MTNYQAALSRVNQASTIKELESLEKSFDRIYSAGFLTDNQLKNLDLKRLSRIHFMELDKYRYLLV